MEKLKQMQQLLIRVLGYSLLLSLAFYYFSAYTYICLKVGILAGLIALILNLFMNLIVPLMGYMSWGLALLLLFIQALTVLVSQVTDNVFIVELLFIFVPSTIFLVYILSRIYNSSLSKAYNSHDLFNNNYDVLKKTHLFKFIREDQFADMKDLQKRLQKKGISNAKIRWEMLMFVIEAIFANLRCQIDNFQLNQNKSG